MSITTLIHIKNSQLYIEAVLQSWYDLSDKIVIINNGSTDDTVNIVKKFDKVIVIDDFRKWIDVGEDTVRNDSLKHCLGSNYIAIPDSDEVLYDDQEDKIRCYLEDTNIGAWKFRSIEYYGDHHYIQDQYRGEHLDGIGEDVVGFGRQVVHGRPFIYRYHDKLMYQRNEQMLYGLHASIIGSQDPKEIRDCKDIVVAHYGNCASNTSLYDKTLFYYNATSDPNGYCRSKEFQDTIDPNNPLGFHPDQAVRPPYIKPPKYMVDHSEAYHRITTTVDDDGKYRISSRSDTPLPVEIKIGTPQECGRPLCEYIDPVFDVDMKRKANEFTVIKALDYYTSTYELCCIHPNVFLMLNENIVYNPQYTSVIRDRISTIQRNARHIICVSQSVRTTLMIEGVPPSKTSVINFWGCDTDFFKPVLMNRGEMRALCSKYNVDIDDRVVLFTGRIDSSKGISYLLDAMRNIDGILLLAGQGDITNFLRGRTEELTRKVKYIGEVSRDKLLELYNLADVLVLPSIPTPTWIEQFGRVLTEGMACGKPCISTAIGGPLDIIDDGNTGYLVPPCDSNALSDKINILLDDPILANSMGINGRDRCIELFSNNASSKMMNECIVNNIWR